jgi:AcrR family transcriptional regulator
MDWISGSPVGCVPVTDAGSSGRPGLRKDAARNRRRILEAARALVREGLPIQLNPVAQRAEVGVGTVYRHFPTSEALVEALAADQFTALIALAEQAAEAADIEPALRSYLRTSLTAYLRDEAFASAVVDPHPVTPDIQRLRQRLQHVTGELPARTADDNALHPSLTAADMMLLLCGVGFAIRHAPDRDDPALADRYLEALLDGALTRRGRTAPS